LRGTWRFSFGYMAEAQTFFANVPRYRLFGKLF